MRGQFITFEGGEGTGKSTQVALLGDYLRSMARDVLITREPGGTPEAETLRGLLVNGGTNRWSAEAEALLNNAARDSHLNAIIRPALAAGKTVICDRFLDSTRAYQGAAGGCTVEFIAALEKAIVGETKPHLTLIFDLDPEVGLARAKSRGDGSEDRYERKGLAFHQALRQGFLATLKAEPARCKLIDASLPIATVHAAVKRAVEMHFHG